MKFQINSLRWVLILFIGVSNACHEAPNSNANQDNLVKDTLPALVQDPVAADTSATVAKPAVPKQQQAIFVLSQKNENDNPLSTVAVNFNGKITTIAQIAGEAALIEKSDYDSKQIPANAVAACGAWWAGAGNYFYLLKSDNRVLVYQGWQEEMQSGTDYHWKKVKEIK